MFDIGWSELLLIGVVAILVVGPRDLPRMMRTVGQYVSKIRRMGRELQSQFDEALREAELDTVRKEMSDLGRINPVRDVREGLTKPLKSVGNELNSAARETEKAAEAPVAAPEPGAPQTAASAEPQGAGEENPAPAADAAEPGEPVGEVVQAEKTAPKRVATGS